MAEDAIALLCNVFAVGQATVYVDGRQFQVIDLYDNPYMFYNMMATDIELTFFGGPPTKGKWFNGTLLTFVLDHAAYQVAKGNCKKISEAIHWING